MKNPNEPEQPFAMDAEQAVIGALLLTDGEALTQVSDWVSADDFFIADHQLIFRAVVDLAAKNQPCDAVTMSEWFGQALPCELERGSNYPIELANTTPSAANIIAYAEIVVEKSRVRQLEVIGNDLARGTKRRNASAAALIATATHELSQLATNKVRGGLSPAKGALGKVFASVLARNNRGPGLVGQPTPWHKLNELTGGLRDRELYILAGRPSMGKSIAGENIAHFAALRGNRTALFAVEMSEESTMQRACAAVAGIPHHWLENPSETADGDDLKWARYTRANTDLVASPLLIDETPGIKIEQLMARARRAHLQQPIRLVVVDHIHEMYRGAKASDESFMLGEICGGLKQIAKELNCPVVALAQLNRNVAARADRRPTLTDLRQAGAIEEKADTVLFIHREDYYDKGTHLRDVVELIPAKGRNLKVGETVHLRNAYDQMRLDDWDGPLPVAKAETQEGGGTSWDPRGVPREARAGGRRANR